jgi:uncharacterized protein YcbK (DUF882 family)
MPSNIKRFDRDYTKRKILSKDFKQYEFDCKCNLCKYTYIDLDLVEKLQQVRDWWGKPLSFSSAYRCETWNKKKGGKPGSYHKKGQAVDISTVKMTEEEATKLFHYCETIFNGCERGNGFIHVDTRIKKVNWSY